MDTTTIDFIRTRTDDVFGPVFDCERCEVTLPGGAADVEDHIDFRHSDVL